MHLATRTIALRCIQTISTAEFDLLLAYTSPREASPAPPAIVVAPPAVVVAPPAVVDSSAPPTNILVRLPSLFLHPLDSTLLHSLRNELSGRLFRFHYLMTTLFHHLLGLDVRFHRRFPVLLP